MKETSVIGYRKLFEVSGIHRSNTGIQKTHDMYINSYFMFLVVLTPERGASEAHTTLPENCNITIELQFIRPLPKSFTCLLYLEYDSTVQVNLSRSRDRFLIHKMDTGRFCVRCVRLIFFLDVSF